MPDWGWIDTPDHVWVDTPDHVWVDDLTGIAPAVPILSKDGIHSLVFGGQVITG